MRVHSRSHASLQGAGAQGLGTSSQGVDANGSSMHEAELEVACYHLPETLLRDSVLISSRGPVNRYFMIVLCPYRPV